MKELSVMQLPRGQPKLTPQETRLQILMTGLGAALDILGGPNTDYEQPKLFPQLRHL